MRKNWDKYMAYVCVILAVLCMFAAKQVNGQSLDVIHVDCQTVYKITDDKAKSYTLWTVNEKSEMTFVSRLKWESNDKGQKVYEFVKPEKPIQVIRVRPDDTEQAIFRKK